MLFEVKGRIAPPSITVHIQPHWKLICIEEAARRQERDNDDCKLIRELYGKYRIVSVENSSGNNASKAELFITSGGM